MRGRPHTRRRRTFDELKRTGDAPGQLERVLDTLVAGRLITTSDGDRVAAPLKMRHFDLAHDALIGGWRELSEWVQHRQGDLIKHRRLEAWAREWVDGNRTSGLLDEGDTAEACAWRDSSGATALGVSPWLVELIEASEAAHARARREKEDMIALLLEEQRKTRASIAAAVQVADQIVFQVDANLRTVPGASRARAVLLEQSRALLESLRALGGLEVAAQRTEMVAKLAQADFAFEHGRLSEAEQLLREVRKHAAKQMKTDPTNPEWQHDLSVSYDRLGAVAFAFGHLDDARRWFKKSLALSQALANADPANLDRQRDLAALYSKIGDVVVAVGKPGDAATWLRKALAVSQPLAEAAPSNTERQRDLAVLYSKMGDVAVASRHIDDARRWFERSLAISSALVAADSANAQRQHDLARWQHDLAVLYSKMGDLAVATGKLDDARAWFEKAVEALADADSDNPMSQRDLLVAHLNVALTEPTAQRHVEQAIAIYERLHNAGAFLGDVHFDQIGEFLDRVRHR